MKNMEPRAFKDGAYAAFATVTKALSHARRLEILDQLAQRPHHVESLARAVGQSVGNASQHLQVLKRARVVETTRHGTSIEYRLAPGVVEVFVALRRLAEARSLELVQVKRDFFDEEDAAIDGLALQRELAAQRVLLLDVRPRVEFEHDHVEGCHSIPIDELEARIDELPSDRLIVATCRGPYCTFAADAVRMLRASGRRAVRFEGGVGEWRVDTRGRGAV